MKNLIEHIQEALKINKDSKVSAGLVDDMIEHFSLDELLKPRKNYMEKEPLLKEEELNEIKKKIEDILSKENAQKLTYYSRCMKYTTLPPKLAKDYIRKPQTVQQLLWYFRGASDNKLERFFKKGALYLEYNPEKNMIGKFGPYGGAWLCQIS